MSLESCLQASLGILPSPKAHIDGGISEFFQVQECMQQEYFFIFSTYYFLFFTYFFILFHVFYIFLRIPLNFPFILSYSFIYFLHMLSYFPHTQPSSSPVDQAGGGGCTRGFSIVIGVQEKRGRLRKDMKNVNMQEI